MLPANVTNGSSSGHVSVVKADGTITDITLTNGVNWFEVDATKAPGLYHVLIPSGATSVSGQVQLVVMPSASAFVATVITGQVESIALDAEIARKVQQNKLKIFATGPNANKMIIYDDDGTTPYLTWNLFDQDGTATSINPFMREP